MLHSLIREGASPCELNAITAKHSKVVPHIYLQWLSFGRARPPRKIVQWEPISSGKWSPSCRSRLSKANFSCWSPIDLLLTLILRRSRWSLAVLLILIMYEGPRYSIIRETESWGRQATNIARGRDFACVVDLVSNLNSSGLRPSHLVKSWVGDKSVLVSGMTSSFLHKIPASYLIFSYNWLNLFVRNLV